jgi:hypothetical protein
MAEKSTPNPLSQVPPYSPYRTFRNFTDSLKQGIPSRIDRSVMSNMSGALQSQLAATLRYLELITSAGIPTHALAALVNSEGAERVQVMRTVLHSAYPFLFDKDKFDLMGATPRMLEEQFAHTGASGGTIDKCINFFLAAAKDADIALSPHLKNQRSARQRARPALRRNPIVMSSPEDGFTDNGSDTGEISWKQMLLSKFPSFDPSWSPEVQAKWFDMFGKLMKQGEEGED